ncbi:MAG: hypothetical protein ABSG55_04540 [Dehalococcoidia bacterium]|jgi:hypothetical protein
MFPLGYLFYVGFIVWALRRTHRSAVEAERLREWRLTAWAMALLPFAGALGALLVAWQTQNAAALVSSFYISGGLLLAVGLMVDRFDGAATPPLLLRLAGWGLVAGLTIIPSTLSLALPLVGLLAFVVPVDYGRRRSAQVVA